MTPRRILVTSALPYANGHIHLGHLVEYIQTDVWVRFQRLRGHECIYLCADDTHGTAIMNRARLEGRSEEAVIGEMHVAHRADFAGFGISFDHYGSTNSAANRRLCGEIWAKLVAGGYVAERDVVQLFDPEAGTFLADRFVKGTCPKCKAPDQYGDSCEICGTTYSAADLIDPKSTLSGATPVLKQAKHLFVEIEKLHDFLADWTQRGDHLQPEIANYLQGHFLGAPLRPWDVSRPAPYFGFDIPGTNGEHYWYVWFDAPVGYVAATAEWCEQHGQTLDRWWHDPATEIHHFIGKDITYFHTLFWPAMLKAAGMNLPTKVRIHGFLTVDGAKMSKSRGTLVRASTYLERLDPQYLRYYYASKLSSKVDDLDLNLEEFVFKVNADLVNKVVNIASRTAKFAETLGLSATYPEDGSLFAAAADASEEIAQAYEVGDYGQAVRRIMELADAANRYIEHHQPWKLKNAPERQAELRDICTIGLNLFRQLTIYLSPVLPKLAEQTGELLNDPIVRWDQARTPLTGTAVKPFVHMMKRVELKQVQQMIEDGKETSHAPPATGANAPPATATNAAPATAEACEGAASLVAEPLVATPTTFDDFMKLDLRVGRILTAEADPKSKKLLKLSVQIGEPRPRTIFAGIQGTYDPATLVGRLVVIVANLPPRKMPSGLSEGMVLAAGPGGKDIFLLSPDSGAQPGQRVH